MLKVMGGFVTWEALTYVLQDLNLRAKKKGIKLFWKIHLFIYTTVQKGLERLYIYIYIYIYNFFLKCLVLTKLHLVDKNIEKKQ